MDRLASLEVLIAIVDTGSLAAAARRLGLSPPAVTRALAGLEARLGTRLIARTTRSLALTDVGRRFVATARNVLAELDEAERAAAGEATTPVGHLSVTAPVTFGRLHVAPVLGAFLQAHAQITASLWLVDRSVDLVGEGIDIALRIGTLADSALIVRRIGAVRRMLAASPDYLAAMGEPGHPRDLAAHRIIAFSGPTGGREARFVEAGRAFAVPLAPRLEVNDAMAAIAAAEAGHGITAALSYQLAASLAAGRLVPILEPFATPPLPVQLVYPPSRIPAAKVRVFIDAAAGPLAAAATLP